MSAEKKNQVKGSKWILVMDDDEVIRMVTRAILEQIGYRVCLTENGDEAVESYKEARTCGYPFDAVIVDLHVPGGKGGKETIGNLLKIDPHAKVILTSGDISDPAMSNHREYGFRDVLIKPFMGNTLQQKVQRVLSEEGYHT
jgi:CheY-like chemotaxis protein